jgi:hypothetical protein
VDEEKKEKSKLKHRRMCKLVKEHVLRDDPEAYLKLSASPTHLCLKCGRVSNKKKRLCEPEKLEH